MGKEYRKRGLHLTGQFPEPVVKVLFRPPTILGQVGECVCVLNASQGNHVVPAVDFHRFIVQYSYPAVHQFLPEPVVVAGGDFVVAADKKGRGNPGSAVCQIEGRANLLEAGPALIDQIAGDDDQVGRGVGTDF